MKHDYTFLDFIHDDAFKALSEYLFQLIIGEDIKKIESRLEDLAEFWKNDKIARGKAKTLAKSILNGSHDKMLKVATPETKGKLLAVLKHRSLLSFEEKQEDAVNHILKFTQSKNEAKQIFESISLNGGKVSAHEGKRELNALLDGADKLIFQAWERSLEDTPPRVDEEVMCLNELPDYEIPNFPVNLKSMKS